MKKKYKALLISVLIISFTFLSGACQVSRSLLDPDTVTGDRAPLAPSWIHANFIVNAQGNKLIQVEWEPSASQYTVYRRLGFGEWETVVLQKVGATYQDTQFYASLGNTHQPKTIQYAVKSISGSIQSELSVPSTPTSPVVLESKASILTENKKICLQWDSHAEAQSYRIYRLLNGPDSMAQPQLIKEVLPSASVPLVYHDVPLEIGNDPKPSNFYYYLVTWVKDGVEYGKVDGIYTPGCYTDVVDLYESNDEWTSLSNQTSLFSDVQPPLMYAITDGYGSTLQDCDWYQYTGPAGKAFSVQVTLPPDTQFNDEELCFRFYYNGTYFPAKKPEVINTGTQGTNEFTFTQFSPEASGNQTIYFKIEPKNGITRNVIGTYFVQINTSQ